MGGTPNRNMYKPSQWFWVADIASRFNGGSVNRPVLLQQGGSSNGRITMTMIYLIKYTHVEYFVAIAPHTQKSELWM